MTREQGTLNWEQGRERRDFGQLYFSLLMLVFFRSPTYNLKKSPVCAKPKIINATN
jgi:hypothetical protein